MLNAKGRGKKVIHVEYTRVYHELLKFEEVLDIDLDRIYQAYLKSLADFRIVKDLSQVPDKKDIEILIYNILDRLEGKL